MRKILITGNIIGAYRSQFVIEKLIEYDPEVKYSVSFVIPGFGRNSQPAKGIIEKITNKFKSIISGLFTLIELFIKLGLCDIVFVMPMNHQWFLRVYICNLLWRRKIVTDLYISIYDTAIDRKYFEKPFLKRLRNGWFRWYFKLLDRLIIEKSTKVVHVTKTELEYIARLVNAKLDTEKYAIIPLGVSKKTPASPLPLDVFRICWWGTWIPLHGLKNILLAVKILKDKEFTFTLDLFGTPGSQSMKYVELINKLGISSCVTIHQDKFFSNKKLEEHLITHCDLALGNFGDSEKAKIVIVNKIIDAFSLQLPILTMQTSVLEEFIDVTEDLFTCSRDPESIANAIIGVESDKVEMARRAKNGLYRFKKTFTFESMTEKYIHIFQDIDL